ncbi:MAG: low molecular weight protein-tyrosine-phosphatase [bacterium]
MKVLFVCTGNICRSPLAEGILRDKLSKRGTDIQVDSCGFESFHKGDPPDQRALSIARKRGIDISGHASRLFTIRDFDAFDRIYVMDASHYGKLMRLARNETDRRKVDYILNILHPGKNIPVPDPWYEDLAAFEKVYNILEPACEKIALELDKNFSGHDR